MIESNDYPTLIREALSAYGPIPEILLIRAVIKQVEPIRRNRQVIVTRIQRTMREMKASEEIVQNGNLYRLKELQSDHKNGDEVIAAFAYIRDHGPIFATEVRHALGISAYAVSLLEDLGVVRHTGGLGGKNGQSKELVIA